MKQYLVMMWSPTKNEWVSVKGITNKQSEQLTEKEAIHLREELARQNSGVEFQARLYED